MTTNEQKKVVNKTDFISMLAKKSGQTIKFCGEMIDHFEELVSEILSNKEQGEVKISFLGFMNIVRKKTAKRMVTNPQTGKKQVVPAKYSVKMKAGQKLASSLPKLEEA
jgi:nucleoid DNA-binding protein